MVPQCCLQSKGEGPPKIIRCVTATRDAPRTGKAFLKTLLPKRTKVLLEVELATCRTSLFRARLDLVCILLDRRNMSSFGWMRYNNSSIHIPCDSSPIAKRDLIGMVMDVFFLGMT